MRVIWPAPSHMILTPWQFFLKTMLIYIPNSWSVQPYPWLKLVIPYRFTWSFSIPKIRSRLRVRRKNLRRRESNWMHRQGIWSPGCRTLSSASTQSTTSTSSEREVRPVSGWKKRNAAVLLRETWWNSHARRLTRFPPEFVLLTPLWSRFSSPNRCLGAQILGGLNVIIVKSDIYPVLFISLVLLQTLLTSDFASS